MENHMVTIFFTGTHNCLEVQGSNAMRVQQGGVPWRMAELGCDAIDKLKQKLSSLEKEINDQNKFKEFYQFTFNYAKNPSQKGLDLEMALAYWNIVMAGRFKFLGLWSLFLEYYFFGGRNKRQL